MVSSVAGFATYLSVESWHYQSTLEARAMSFFASLLAKGFRLPKLGRAEANLVKSIFLPMFWRTKNFNLVVQHIKAASEQTEAGCFFGDNLFTWGRNMSMLDDEVFVKAWDSNAETDADKAIIWRRYILACAGYHCVQLEGDFVECGAYAGVGVKTVVDYLGGVNFPKDFWIYDLFEHEEWMEHHAMPEHGPGLEVRVRNKFKDYPQVKVVKGYIPETFQGQSPDAVAYLHIDLNEASAEIAALDSLFDRVVPGGIVILDDYEWAGVYRAQKLAEDPWFEARQYRVIPLPTGQGLVIKR
jgi:O-methyltransferase